MQLHLDAFGIRIKWTTEKNVRETASTTVAPAAQQQKEWNFFLYYDYVRFVCQNICAEWKEWAGKRASERASERASVAN